MSVMAVSRTASQESALPSQAQTGGNWTETCPSDTGETNRVLLTICDLVDFVLDPVVYNRNCHIGT